DYGEALSKSLLYFEAQRSGHLPYHQRVTWRHHSALDDGLQEGVDLVGGYYDAGDNVKFGLPMAYAITLLSWGIIQYRDEIVAAGEFRHAIAAVKWGTDYFIKAHAAPRQLWIQVGEGEMDHQCWQRPEDMTTSRRAFKVDDQNPGSEVAAETAAAMAAASILFDTIDRRYSRLLLHHAHQLFELGDEWRAKYDESVAQVKDYYPSKSGYMDELLWAAIWLYKATNTTAFLDYVLHNAAAFGGTTWAIAEFSWDVKYAGVQILAATLPREGRREEELKILDEYASKAEFYVCACMNRNSRTPAGLLYTRRWNNMQYVSGAVLLTSVYSDHLRSTNSTLECGNTEEILGFAKSQVDYILGSNPTNMSYLVGYGASYPARVHHRGASTVSYKESREFCGCMEGYHRWFVAHEPNPNVLVGALVGGPDSQDGFSDRRDNFAQTEACLYNTAPLVGVFAKL
ncbi:hypothetical protein M569_04556, partial [Genlisea aurea]